MQVEAMPLLMPAPPYLQLLVSQDCSHTHPPHMDLQLGADMHTVTCVKGEQHNHVHGVVPGEQIESRVELIAAFCVQLLWTAAARHSNCY